MKNARLLLKGLPFLALAAGLGGLLLRGGPSSPEGNAKYGLGTWDSESGLGNHRAVVRVELPPAPPPAKGKGKKAAPKAAPSVKPSAVRAHIPWRRRDLEPEKKGLIVIDGATGSRVANVYAAALSREAGDIIFEPATVPGDYYVYYLPYKSEGRKNYPNVKYSPPEATAEASWLVKNGLPGPGSAAGTAPAGLERFPEAALVELQAVDEFSRFDPMEIIATAAETHALLDRYPDRAFLLFPEDRRLSIRMSDDLPYRWVETGPREKFEGEADRGEFFTFQVGLWAARQTVGEVEVLVSRCAMSRPVSGGSAPPPAIIPASDVTSFNTWGVNWDGRPFRKALTVEKGQVQALWFGIAVPGDAAPGLYHGTVTFQPKDLPAQAVEVELKVTELSVEAHGDDDPFRMTRLRWLNSTLAADDDIVLPYTPLQVHGLTIRGLGHELGVGDDGLPARIQSFFPPELTRVETYPVVHLIANPVQFRVKSAGGKDITLDRGGDGPKITHISPGAITWEARRTAPDPADAGLSMDVKGRMEFDGFVEFKVTLAATRDLEVEDIALVLPMNPEAAEYMMGLGYKGGLRPLTFEWSWDQKKNQDALWLGAPNAGLQLALRAENYDRPLNTNFYLSKPLNLPPSWWNEGRGRVTVETVGPAPNIIIVKASSGPRTIKAGRPLHFDFNLLLTPFKPLNPGRHFVERYFHAFKPLDEVAATGANVINVHHANAVNPYINYPFLRPAEMKAYIDEAHRRGFKVKIYNTIRELSNRAPELFALRSLGHEIFSSGPGGGFSWLQEHVGSDYIAAWFVPELKDAALINSGMSRWHNYYVEGLDWLARNVGIDGLYIDDVAFDRTTMKRVRKVLDRRRPGALIDLHSANQFNPRDGFASSANLYLEHFPFLNRLWFGEYFDYEGSRPDYWLVELSGIPFGLMGEMLQGGGNPWRGMVFGMTSRLPWAGDPRPLWKAWDEFGIAEAEMVGWWVKSNPVKTGSAEILATAYIRWPGEKNSAAMPVSGRSSSAQGLESDSPKTGAASVLIALASWAKGPVDVQLTIDWRMLGLDPKKVTLRAPAIDKFQTAAEFKPDEPIRIEPGKGWLLVIK
jgi:hypothetical protein